jgi:hypothetical protein
MTADQSLFQGNSPAATPATPAANQNGSDPYAHLLGTILNENGVPKYANTEEALKGAAHAQAYIAQLKREKDELEAKANAAMSAAEKQAELERTLTELTQKVNNPVANQPQGLDPEKIAEYVAQTLDKRTAAEKAKANQEQVVKTLVDKFGAEAEVKFNAAAQELGLSVGEMNELAARSPKVVLKALGVAEQPAPKPNQIAPAFGGLKTEGFQPHQDSFIGRNKVEVTVGASTQVLMDEANRSRKMVEEVHAQGLTMHDLSDPKIFFKTFK